MGTLTIHRRNRLAQMGNAVPLQKPTPDLATIRTELANERTVLAYGRTALMLIATGVSLVKFLNPSLDFLIIGWIMIACGGLVAAIGIRRFAKLRRELRERYSTSD